MTTYFVTGATGFLGKRLVARLLARRDTTAVHVLVRNTSRERLDALAREWPERDRLVPAVGDLTEPLLGLDPATFAGLDHVVHLGAVYDLTADEETNRAANVEGTGNVLAFAAAAGARLLHHVSSIAVAGTHAGRFTESDFDLGQSFESPYHATKFEAEKRVRDQREVPYRVYRPSAVVGDSRSGEMDKIDGPYYFLPAISRLAALPGRLPLAAPDLGATNLVPVDYVVTAMDYLMHREAPSGSTYHLASPRPQKLHEVYNAFARVAGGPRVRTTVPTKLLRATASRLAAGVDRLPAGRATRAAVLNELGVPLEVLPHLSMAVEFDTARTTSELYGSGVELPELRDYAEPLYRYWREHLDPDRARRSGLAGRVVLVTGASSGIGRATALKVARRGAKVVLVARRAEELEELRAEITAGGGEAAAYPCDLTDGDSVDALVKAVLADHGAVDVLVNNAGRSIRRSVQLATERFHDYERTMAINYFGPVRLILGLLPSMTERRSGHVVNVTTMGLQTDTPRFSAYLASKAALEEFGLTAGRETLSDGVTFSSVRMPLVRTAMIAPTGSYRGLPASSPERAAALVVKAIEQRPQILTLPEGRAAELAALAVPDLTRFVAHLAYRVMPESAPEARNRPRQPAPAAVAATLTRLLWRRRG
ncbi:SDR family oxidoreductase [Amycolatopsis jiangsuensis]|uniref:NAD(P)-dependent dehydrogenase (Short-subunit alcohol dehydrogenase family) n=1 Tax=Amycolatopsis jiangsuensis TaxID=1181879 RepID=A0A840IWY2_9PSEU|nr:SDR family oxidoreductase [Amycolatopsis jiangsuensis]MBB4685414.1 NAD(P)-dependent dehydrogenase (short-subunit alcohol dehydrogenase family) [Amycolatopsis jiangsuensis]